MDFFEAKEAIVDARKTIEKGRMIQREMASILAGQLRSSGVRFQTLRALKKELEKYNMQTGDWRD